MATLNDLVEVLTGEYEMAENDIEMVVNYIRNLGTGIYSIAHEYNDIDINRADDIVSFEAERESARSGELFEEHEYDIYEDFNDESNPDGFLFGETYFFVNITKI